MLVGVRMNGGVHFQNLPPIVRPFWSLTTSCLVVFNFGFVLAFISPLVQTPLQKPFKNRITSSKQPKHQITYKTQKHSPLILICDVHSLVYHFHYLLHFPFNIWSACYSGTCGICSSSFGPSSSSSYLGERWRVH